VKRLEAVPKTFTRNIYANWKTKQLLPRGWKWVAERGCKVSIVTGVQDSTEQGCEQPDPVSPALRSRLDSMTSRSPFQPNLFYE